MAKKDVSKPVSYQILNDELEGVLADMQREDIGVDEALKLYERGLELIKQLEQQLQAAEHTITELQAAFTK